MKKILVMMMMSLCVIVGCISNDKGTGNAVIPPIAVVHNDVAADPSVAVVDNMAKQPESKVYWIDNIDNYRNPIIFVVGAVIFAIMYYSYLASRKRMKQRINDMDDNIKVKTKARSKSKGK